MVVGTHPNGFCKKDLPEHLINLVVQNSHLRWYDQVGLHFMISEVAFPGGAVSRFYFKLSSQLQHGRFCDVDTTARI